MRTFFYVLAVVWLVAPWAAGQAITLGIEGSGDANLQNVTLNSDVSTTSPILNSTAVGLIWNGVVTWTGTRGTTTQSMERFHYLEFNVSVPTQISNVTCVSDYQWNNGGGSLTTPTSKSFGRAEVVQYTDANNNGHYDSTDPSFVVTSATPSTLTVTGTGSGTAGSALTDITPIVLGPGTHYILMAELLDTSTFSSPNISDPDNVYTANFSTPNTTEIAVAFNYVALPEPTGAVWMAAGCFVMRRGRRRIVREL